MSQQLLLLAAWLLFFSSVLVAEELQVTVFADMGKVAAEVAVCVGTEQERELYFSGKTDSLGSVVIGNLPEGRIYLTASDGRRGKGLFVTPELSRQVMIALPREENSLRCSDGQSR
ncbi:MAG: hypothetical protein PHC51_01565 [bacterium]|nr:hypothetical protein [bacterium]